MSVNIMFFPTSYKYPSSLFGISPKFIPFHIVKPFSEPFCKGITFLLYIASWNDFF